MKSTDILIVGAGPSGLALALWLTRQGLSLRIVDKAPGPGTASRALAVQARTLELYRQLDIAEAVVAAGYKTPAANFWVSGTARAHIPLGIIGEGLTPYPFLLMFPQNEHERLLVDRLRELGVAVERSTELLDFADKGDRIVARLRKPDGSEEEHEAGYLAGCDGARSTIRKSIGAGFEGGTYKQLFYVADVEASGPAINGELNIDLDEADFLAVFPMDAQGRVRLIGTIRDERAEHAEDLEFEDISDRAIRNLQLQVNRVRWFSTYHVHHRVTDRFRQGRVFLLGDAAHIHSPAGGQGMNTGIADAINLAWKLAAVVKGKAADGLLDSYAIERAAFARKLVSTTDRVFSAATAEGFIANLLRTRLAPLVIPAALSIEAVRDFAFRTIGQIALNYHDSPLSDGKAGDVQGGDRLPWVAVDGRDNFAPLPDIGWQVHLYGAMKPALVTWCQRHDVALKVFDWHSEHEAAGFRKDAAYLLRPDTYVAVADPTATPAVFDGYLADRQLVL